MNNHTVEEINEYLPQASTIINLLSYSDDYGRSSATNMRWYKDTGTAAASSRKYTDVSVAAVIPDNTWGSADHTTRAEFRKAVKTAVANLDNPDYNQGFALGKAVTTGTKDNCLFLPYRKSLDHIKALILRSSELNTFISSPTRTQQTTS